MKEKNVLITVLLLSLFFSIFSIFAVNVAVQINDYQIGDLNGVVYEKIWSPFIGFCSVWMVYFILRNKEVIGRRFTLLNLTIFSVVIILIVHMSLFYGGYIGGWYNIPEGIKWEEKTNDDIIRLSNSRNYEIAGQAWGEFLRRGKAKPELLVSYLDYLKSVYPSDYFDSTKVHDVIEILSLRRDERVIKYLKEMLDSSNYIEVEEPIEKIKRIYPSRVIAEKYLKFFGEEHE